MRDEELIKYLSKNLITESKRPSNPESPDPRVVFGGPPRDKPDPRVVLGGPPKPDNPNKPIRLPIPNKEDETKKGKYGNVRYPTKPNPNVLGETSNYKEYFKQQLVESIMEDTFAERLASKGPKAALEKAKYFKGLMQRLEDRRANMASAGSAGGATVRSTEPISARGRERDPFVGRVGEVTTSPWARTNNTPAGRAARSAFVSNPRVQAMSVAHMGNAPDTYGDGSFRNPIEAGVEGSNIQKINQTAATNLGRQARGTRAAANRKRKFTI